MLEVKSLTQRFGQQLLFEDVNLKFNAHNRYGLIGANGAGKSTFFKILSGETDYTSGEIVIENGKKVRVLGQDQFAFESFTLKDAVLYGNKRLYDAVKEKEKLYMSEEFSDEVNERLSELEIISAEEDPTYEYETRIEKILSSLGLYNFDKLMSEVESSGEFNGLRLAFIASEAKITGFGNGVLILDEIDSNLSGKEAMSIADVLLELAKFYQIFAISHQPQLSSKAHHHFLVEKNGENSFARELDANDRIKELSRMISGEVISEEAREFAKTLLNI